MIIVELEVPIMGKKYDFQIDENRPMYEVKSEIAELICRKEQCRVKGDEDRLMFWSPEGKKLALEQSAGENGLRTGGRIILV